MVRVILAAVVLFGAALFFGGHPSSHLWALSNGADLPVPLRMIWMVWGAVVIAVATGLTRASREEESAKRKRFEPSGMVLAVAGLVLFALFFLLRSRNHFLGDGWMVITLLENEDLPVVNRAGIGTVWAYRLIFQLLRGAGVPDEWAFALPACAAGVVYGWIVLRWVRFVADRFPKLRSASLLLAAVPLTAGTMQLYFGYVETYVLAHIFLAAFLVEGGIALIRRERSVVPALLFFVLAVFAHWVVITILPAVIFLLLERWPGAPRNLKRLFPAAAVIFVLLVGPTLSQLRIVYFFIPWIVVGRAPYGILSGDHLLLSANFLLLLVPVPLVLLAAWWRGGSRDRETANGVIPFFRSACLSAAAFAFAEHPALGPRDWDLLSFFVVPLTLWIPLRIAVAVRSRDDLPLGALVLGMGLFFLAPWVIGNRTIAGGAERVARMVRHDPYHFRQNPPRISGLAWLMVERGAGEVGFDLYQYATGLFPENPIVRTNMGILYWQRGEYEKAKPHFETAVRIDPGLGPAVYNLGTVRFHLREGDLGESEFRRFLKSQPDNPSASSYLGRVLLWQKRYDEALTHFLVAHRSLPNNADLNVWIAQALTRLGRSAEAVSHLERAVAADPSREDVKKLLDEIGGE